MARGYSNKFNRGEVDEGVMARDDVERVHNSGSLMDNFMPQRIGPMVYRPGTEYLGDALPNGSHFLMAFVDDGTTPTILEFSQSTANPSVESLRFWLDGTLAQATATVDTITNGGFTGSITGWTDASTGAGSSAHDATNDRLDLTGGTADGDWGRVYQTLTCTSGERTLYVEVADTPMTIQIGTNGAQSADIFTDTLGFGVHLLTWVSDGSATTVTLANDKPYSSFCNTVAYEAAGDLKVVGNMVTDTSTTAATLQTLRYTQINDVMFITDGAYELSGFSWPFWIIKRRGNKSWSFELPNTIDGPFGPINLSSTTLTPGATSGDTTLTASNDFFDASGSGTSTYDYYQLLHGDVYGICQVTSVQSATVANVRVTSEFGGTTATVDWWQGLFGSYLPSPTATEVFESRLYLAGGSRLYGSVSDLYTSFDELISGDSAAITKTIGFGPVQDVSWLVGGDVLMMGLSSEEVQISSSGDFEAITSSNANVRRGSNKGSARIRPQIVDQIIYFVNRGLKKLYALSGLKGEQIQAHDTTLLHPEILDPGVKRIIYSSEPEPRMYCLLTDGSVRVLLFDNVEEVTAWSRITLGGGGTVEDMVSAPTGNEDEIYMVVERDGTRYIERLAKFSESIGGADSRHYDSHVYAASPGATFSGLDHLEGLTVYVWADGVEKGRDIVASGSITLNESDWTDVVVGLRHTATWKSNKLARYVTNTVLNYRKRVVQIGLVMRSVALRNFRYGPDSSTLSDMPEIDRGRARAPTTEPEPTITDTLTGLTINDLDVQGNYVYAACSDVPAPPTSNNHQAMEYYNGKLYLGGGAAGLTQWYEYDISTAALAVLTDIPNGFSTGCSTEHNGVIYLFHNNASGFQAYDVATSAWLTVSQPTTHRDDAAMAAYNGVIYQYGGDGGGPTTTWQIYTIATDTWSYTAFSGTIEAKEQHDMVAVQSGTGAGVIYITCGYGPTALVDSNRCYSYTVGTNTMAAIASHPVAKEDHQIVAGNDGYLYDWSGKPRVGTTNYDIDVNRYDISGNTWGAVFTGTYGSQGVTEPWGRTDFGMAMDTANNNFYIWGGTKLGTGADLMAQLWAFNTDDTAWTKVSDQLAPRAGAFRAVDASDLDILTDVSFLNLTSSVSSDDLLGYAMLVDGDYAYVVTREDDDGTLNRGLAVVDISTNTSPSQVGYDEGIVQTPSSAIVKVGDVVYVPSQDTNGSLAAIDVSDPTAPAVVGEVALTYGSNPPNPIKMGTIGTYVITAWEDDIHVTNVTDPTAMTDSIISMSGVASAATGCIVDDGWLYVMEPSLGKVHAYSIDQLPTAVYVGSITNASTVGMVDAVAYSPWLYVNTATTGVVLDFRDPTAPTTYATYTGFTGITSLASRKANVFFAGGSGGLLASDQRSWLYVDYDEMSFEFNGTYDTDARITLEATGPAQVLAITYEVEDIDDPTDGSARLE
jgi:hypothetical protein